MTVSSTSNRKEYVGDDGTVAFATTPVVFFDDTDLEVYVVVTATGAATLKTLTTHYTVSGGDGAVGTVTMTAAPASTETLVIVRTLPLTQTVDFVNNDPSDANVAETVVDKNTMVDQQLSAQIDRSFRLADSDVSGVDVEFPDQAARANKLFGFGASGEPYFYTPAAAITDADDISFVPAGTGAVTRTAQSKMRDVVSVKDFGAVGDGVTDDTAAIQAACDAAVAASTYASMFFPPGIYKSGRLDFSATNYQNAKQISLFGIPKASRILSTVSGTTALIDIGTLAGYGDSDKWSFQDLGLKAATPGNGKGILFQALGWHPKFINLDVDGFQNGLELRSAITPKILGCRIRNCTVAGLDIFTSSTGNPALDQTPTTARIINSDFSGNAKGINRSGTQAYIDGGVFEGNTTFGLNANGMGEGSVVSNTWHEGITDSIDGEAVYVSFINCHGIMSDNNAPLFTNSGAMFSISAANDVMALHCGQFNNKRDDQVWRYSGQRIRSTRQFDGATKNFASPGASGSAILADDITALTYSGNYTAGGAYQCAEVVNIIETNTTPAAGRYEYTFLAMGSIDGTNINILYMLPSGAQLTIAGIGVKGAASLTEFALYRDGATGSLGVQWANKDANTTAIKFFVRPLADYSA